MTVNREIDGLWLKAAAALKEGDIARVQELAKEIETKDAEAGRLAREVGLEECG